MGRQVAFITGASRGIGRALALHLAKGGWELWLAATSADRLAQLAVEIESIAPPSGARIRTVSLDVSDTAAVDFEVGKALAELGRIDLLFNNAAINFRGTVELSPDEYRRLLGVNVFGAWNLLRATVPTFKTQRAGLIVNLSSVAGLVGFAGGGAYCSSKFALRALNESLFQELTPFGVKVTALCPSWVNTDMASYAPITGEQMIATSDLCRTVDYLLGLSPTACIKELTVDCASDPLGATPPHDAY